MVRSEYTRSLTEFSQNAHEHLDRLAATGGVEVLTVNGEARGVVMSPKVFDELAAKARQAEITDKIKRGMAEIEAGEGMDGREAMKDIADRHGLKLNQ